VKTRTWILLFGLLFLLLAGTVLLQHRLAVPAARAELWVEGTLLRTVDLSRDDAFRLETDRGWLELEVSAGTIRVLSASCPDGDCVRCGAKNSGAPIVCLPNRVSIRFPESRAVDGVTR